MLLAVLLGLMLAPADPVTIYVGPNVRDGFVDVDSGVLDSIEDIKKELALLRVGSYERAFFAEDHEYDSWRKCAQRIAKDLSVWLAANRERVAGKE